MSNVKPGVLIYRDVLLPPSETFIKWQSSNLTRFEPYYAGLSVDKSLKLPDGKLFTVGGGGNFYLDAVKKLVFKYCGVDFGLSSRIARVAPKLIHAHFGTGGVTALPIAEKLNIPLVVTFHGFDATVSKDRARLRYMGGDVPSILNFLSFRLYIKKRGRLMEKAALLLAVSDFIKGELIEQGFPENRIIRHYIGVDTRRFAPDPSVKRLPVVLFVGRMVEVKGLEFLIEAMKLVQGNRPDIELVAIGDGPLRASLESMAGRLLKKYRFPGTLPQENVLDWMRRAQVLAAPSVTASNGATEGFGLVTCEAMAMGTPVAGFRSGGIPEAVSHGHTGLLARERDTRALAENITRLFDDDTMWRSFGSKGRERVLDEFDLKKQTAKLEDLYVSVVEKGREYL